MSQLLNLAPSADISAEMIVEILAGEVARRMRSTPKMLMVTMVDRVMSEELEAADESLRQQVIERILSMKSQPTRIQPKSVLTFLWAIHPNAPSVARFEMRAVRRRRRALAHQLTLLEEQPSPKMDATGLVIFP